MEEFSLDGHEFIPLDDLLKATGFCPSGGTARIAISQGRVKVDGKTELRKRCKIRPGQRVDFEGREVVVR